MPTTIDQLPHLAPAPQPFRDFVSSIQSPDDTPTGKRPYRKVTLTALAAVVAALIAIVIWSFERTGSAPRFQLARLGRGNIESMVAATGTCNAVVSVQVGSQVSGNIKALYADFNTRVKGGQLVALIDPEIFQAKVAQADAAWRQSRAALDNARAEVQKAEADLYSAKAAEANQSAAIARGRVAVADASAKLARRQKMFAEEILSQEDLDTAQATFDEAVAELNAAEAQHDAAGHNIQSAEAAFQAANKQVDMFQNQVDLSLATLNQARIDLAHTRITAPVDGTVVARRMDVGQTVAASFQAPTIFEIAQDLTKMQVDTNVAESDVGRLNVGQPANFSVDAYPGNVFEGRITQIRKAPINVQNVITYDAVIEVANPDLKLFPGMTANVTILTQRKDNVLRLPNGALRFKPPASTIDSSTPVSAAGQGNWGIVYIPASNAKVLAIAVKLGITDGSFTATEEGTLAEGQNLVVGISSSASSSAPPASSSLPRRF